MNLMIGIMFMRVWVGKQNKDGQERKDHEPGQKVEQVFSCSS